MASVELGEGIGHETMVNSALASQVRRAGGDTAILLGADRSMSGVVPVGMMLAVVRQRTHSFQVIRYLD